MSPRRWSSPPPCSPLLGLGTDRPGSRAAGLREVAGQLRGMAEVIEDLAAAEARYAALRANDYASD